MTIQNFGDINRWALQIDKKLQNIYQENVKLRDRITRVGSESGGEAWVASVSSANSLIVAGQGLTGGGLIPGTVTIAAAVGNGIEIASNAISVDLHDTWSGLEFDSAELRINQADSFQWSADHAWDTDTLLIDISEHAVYINSGTLPTYRGAITVTPNVASQVGMVVEGYATQTANLFEVRDNTHALLLRINNEGDLESGNFVSGASGWQAGFDGNAEFNNITARGEFHASVFVINELSCMGGTFMVLEASKIYEDVTTS